MVPLQQLQQPPVHKAQHLVGTVRVVLRAHTKPVTNPRGTLLTRWDRIAEGACNMLACKMLHLLLEELLHLEGGYVECFA